MAQLMGIRRVCVIAIALSLAAVGCASKQEVSRSGAVKTEFDKTTKNPEFTPDTHFAAGQLAESQGNIAAAIAQYEAAVKTDSKHAASLYRLGILYTQQKKYTDAVSAWNDYVKAASNTATGYSNLGFCLELAGRNDEAETAYKKGIAKDPKNAPCRVNYGLMLARHGHTAEAIVQLQSVLTAAEVHYNLASVYEAQGRKSQARLEYEKAVALNPDFGDAKARLAAISPTE